jgi:peptidoglycan/xylan/chitin deacetylase (PgdA/CDA1 family)
MDGKGRASARAAFLVGTLALAAALPTLLASSPTTASDGALRVPVLMYHRISEPPPGARLPQLWIAPRLFRAQLRRLADAGWQTITAERLARAVQAGRTVGPKRFVITIDDGARDGFRNAKPIMEARGMRGTYCVVPGRADRDWQLSPRQLVRLHAQGHEIANHSLTHRDLPTLGTVALRRQVVWAARRIERFVGERPATFCYPFGHTDLGVQRMVAQTGHLAAFTTVEGAAGVRRQRFRWPRIRVSASTSPSELLSRLRPHAKGGGSEPPRPVIPAVRITSTLD